MTLKVRTKAPSMVKILRNSHQCLVRTSDSIWPLATVPEEEEGALLLLGLGLGLAGNRPVQMYCSSRASFSTHRSRSQRSNASALSSGMSATANRRQ